jgi:hypothetical protein
MRLVGLLPTRVIPLRQAVAPAGPSGLNKPLAIAVTTAALRRMVQRTTLAGGNGKPSGRFGLSAIAGLATPAAVKPHRCEAFR